MFCSHSIFSSAEFILKLILTFRRLRIISKWSSIRSMKRYRYVILAPLLPAQVSSHRFLISHVFSPKAKRKNMVRDGAAELQSGRRSAVPRGQMREGWYKCWGMRTPPQHCPFHLMLTANCFTLLNPMWTQPAAEKHFTEVKVSSISIPIWKKGLQHRGKRVFISVEFFFLWKPLYTLRTLTFLPKPTPPSWPWQHQSTSEARRTLEEKRIWGFFTKTDTFLSLCQQEGAGNVTLTFPKTSEEALQLYRSLGKMLTSTGMQLRHLNAVPPQAHGLGSAPLQQVRHTSWVLVLFHRLALKNSAAIELVS